MQDNNLSLVDYEKIGQFLSLHPFIVKSFLEKSPLSVQRFFYFLYGDFYTTTSPFVFKEMKKAVELIHEGCEKKQSFYIMGDKDADGVTSISIVKIFLERLGVEVHYNLPLGKESYGFSERIFDDIVSKKENLCCVITVDCGIKENHFIERLNQEGILTIITDHHKLDSLELPQAYAIINPHLYEQEFLPLCGGALAFKLIQAIYLSYTSYYHKKVIYVLGCYDKKGLQIALCENIYSPVQYSALIEDIDDCDELINLLEDSAYLIITSEKDLSYVKDSILEEQAEQVIIVEQFYKKYTKKDVSLNDIIKIESLYPHSHQNVLHFGLLARKLICKYHLNLEDKLSLFIEYMGVSLICDRMDLNHPETHISIKAGLKHLLSHKYFSPLKLLFNNDNLYFDIEKTVAIQIGPLLNAAGRMGKANEVVDFLVSPNKKEALAQLDRLKKLNQERQKIQQSGLKEVTTHLELDTTDSSQSIILYASNTIEQGFTGILANNISKAYSKPAIIIAINEEKGVGIGSGRTQSKALHPILAPINDLFVAFGGHNKACGFTIPLDKLPKLKEHVHTFDMDSLSDSHDDQEYIIDLKDLFMINSLFIESLEKMEPFGEAHPKPLFKSQITIKSIQIFGKEQNHLKIKAYENPILDIIIWKKAEDYTTLLEAKKITMIYNLNYNIYRNGFNAIIHRYSL